MRKKISRNNSYEIEKERNENVTSNLYTNQHKINKVIFISNNN